MPPNAVFETDIPHLVDHTLPYFHRRGKFETIYDYQNFVWLDMVLREERLMVQTGKALEWRYVFDGNGSFRFAALHEPRGQRNLTKTILKGTEPWKHADFEVYVEENVVAQMRDEAEIVDYLELAWFMGFKEFAEGIEFAFAQTPDDADDRKNPHGFPWWVRGPTKGTEDYDGGFNGQTSYYKDGTGTTTQGGLDAATNAKLRNWCANHRGFGPELIAQIIRGRVMSNYVPPKTPRETVKRRPPKRVVFWPLEFQAEYVTLANTRYSDGRNRDLAPIKAESQMQLLGDDTFGLATLSDHADQPVFDINFAHLRPAVLKGRWLKQLKTKEHEDIDELFITRFKNDLELICDNMRLGGACYTLVR